MAVSYFAAHEITHLPHFNALRRDVLTTESGDWIATLRPLPAAFQPGQRPNRQKSAQFARRHDTLWSSVEQLVSKEGKA